MKRENFLKRVGNLLMVAVMMMAVVACGPDTPEPGPDDELENEEFIINIDELTASSITITVTPPAYDPIYFACLYPDTEISLGSDDAALLDGILSSDTFDLFVSEGQQTFEFQGLIGNSNYRLVYFSCAKDGSQVLSDLYRSDRIVTPEGEKMFNITVSNITGMSADVKIEPKDKTMTYDYYLDEMADYVGMHNSSDYELIQFDFDYWRSMASMYGCTVADLLSERIVMGDYVTTSMVEMKLMEWDTEYYAYAYGLDENGTLLSHVSKEVFRTAAPKKSDVTFTIGEPTFNYYFHQEEGYGAVRGWRVDVPITPSDPEAKYFVTVTNSNWYDWYFGEYNDGRSDYKYIQLQILNNAIDGMMMTSVDQLYTIYKQGECVYNPQVERDQNPLKENYGYVVLVFGVDENGATTDVITTKHFTTDFYPVE